MQPSPLVTAFVVIVLSLAPRHADAQRRPHGHGATRDAEDDAEEAAYAPGFEAVRNGQREEALRLFRDLWTQTHAPRAVARMGTVEIQLGRWVDGEMHVRLALSHPEDRWVAAHRSDLEHALQNARAHLTELTVTSNVAGARLSVEGVEVGVLPLTEPVRVPRGSVRIDLRAEGYEPVWRTIVTGAEVSQEHVELASIAAASQPPRVHDDTAAVRSPSAPASSFPARPLAITSFAVGALGIGFGAVALVLRNAHAEDFNRANCWVEGDVARGGCDSDHAAVQTWQSLSIGAFAGGGALLVGGLVLWLAAPRAASSTALRCAPGVSAPGLSCALHF